MKNAILLSVEGFLIIMCPCCDGHNFNIWRYEHSNQGFTFNQTHFSVIKLTIP